MKMQFRDDMMVIDREMQSKAKGLLESQKDN